jgi:putative spermidine/putrescine transport system permease protein
MSSTNRGVSAAERGAPAPSDASLRRAAKPRAQTTRLYWLTILPAATMLLVLYVAPLARVLWISVTEPAAGLDNYALLFSSASVQRTLLTTVRIAAEVTVSSVILGYLAAYCMQGARTRMQRWMLFCVLFPFWISVLIRAFAWVTLLRSNGVLNTVLLRTGMITAPLPLVRNETGVVIGMVHYMLPYSALILYAAMLGVDRRLVSVARGLGATRWQAFRRVMLPLTAPGILAAAAFVFIFSVGFYVTPAILGGGKVLMVAEYIALQINETLRWGLGAMLATTLVVCILGTMALVSRLVDLRRALAPA